MVWDPLMKTKGTVEDCTFLVYKLSLSDMDASGDDLLILDSSGLKWCITVYFFIGQTRT